MKVFSLFFLLFFCLTATQAFVPISNQSMAQSWELFTDTSADQNFVVPAGVTSIRVLLTGGGGGGASGHQGGGGSGFVTVNTIPTTPGETLIVRVGAGGAGAVAQNDNPIVGLTAGTASSLLRGSTTLLTADGGLVVTDVNEPGNNGGSGGGSGGNSGLGGAGGTAGSDGGGQNAGTGQGSYTVSLSQFTQNTISAGAGGAGGTMSHGGGGGGGGILFNGGGASGSSGSQPTSGQGGAGYGGGGGAGGFDFASNPIRFAGGNGASGVVYLEFVGPTAATVSVSGRVITTNGRGISGVRLSLTDSEGNVRTATTTSLGYYHFDDVQVGETYILSVKGKHYTFNQPLQVLTINEETAGVNFIANSEKRLRMF